MFSVKHWKRGLQWALGPLLLIGIIVAVIAAPGRPSRLLARPLPAPASEIRPTPTNSFHAANFFPNSGLVEQGKTYRFTLSTHCGLDGVVDFNGRLWDYSGPGNPDDGNNNPPLGFDNPSDHGTMTLVSQDVAEYESSQGVVIRYERREKPKEVPMCM